MAPLVAGAAFGFGSVALAFFLRHHLLKGWIYFAIALAFAVFWTTLQ